MYWGRQMVSGGADVSRTQLLSVEVRRGMGNFEFFSHRECEYFPCHRTNDPDNFNCLFCYCPLYALGDKCGGNFTYTDRGVKNCTGCMLPHVRENYRYVTKQIHNLYEKMAEERRGSGDA